MEIGLVILICTNCTAMGVLFGMVCERKRQANMLAYSPVPPDQWNKS